MYTKELEVAKKLAVLAGDAIMEIYATDFDVDYKEDESPLTLADQTANDLIVGELKEVFPEISILSEEDKTDTKRFENDLVWVIDPLDGTKEFIKKNGEFTVNIALTYKKKPVLGVIYAPVLDKLYYASEGTGAFLVEKGEERQIHVSDKVSDLLMIGSKSHPHEKEEEIYQKYQDRIRDKKSAGSSLKGALIAEGAADIYYRFGLTSEWDVCAMHAIVLEAGGVFRQINHEEMVYNREDNLNRNGFYVLNRVENLFV